MYADTEYSLFTKEITGSDPLQNQKTSDVESLELWRPEGT